MTDEVVASQDILEEMREEAEIFGFSNPKKTKIDGDNGLLVNFSGIDKGRAIQGKIIIGSPRFQQEFYISAMALKKQWKELEPVFDAVLESVTFFETQPFELGYEDFSNEDFKEVEESPIEINPEDSSYLGEVYHHIEGGFSFRRIADYDFVDDYGTITMAKLGLTSNAGPKFTVIYQSLPEPMTNEELFDNPCGTGSKYHTPTPYVLEGVEGMLFNFNDTEDDVAIQGQVFLALFTPYEYFNVNVFTPTSEWAEIHPIFQALLVTFDFNGEAAAPPDTPVQVICQWVMPARSARKRRVSGISQPSRFITKLKMSPPSLH